MLLILLKLFDDFGYSCALLQSLLRFLLVLPEIFSADLFFQRSEFFLFRFYFKDNLEGARLCFLLLHTFVLILDPLRTPFKDFSVTYAASFLQPLKFFHIKMQDTKSMMQGANRTSLPPCILYRASCIIYLLQRAFLRTAVISTKPLIKMERYKIQSPVFV
jgi:hypothetical protein